MKKLLIMSIALVAIMATVFTVSAFAANTVTIDSITLSKYIVDVEGVATMNDAYANVTVNYTVTEDTAGAVDRLTFYLAAQDLSSALEGEEAKVIYIDEQVEADAGSLTFVIEKSRVKSALSAADDSETDLTYAGIESLALTFKLGGANVDAATSKTVVYNNPTIYGDVDNANGIAAKDAAMIARAAAGTYTLTSEGAVSADVDGANGIAAKDAAMTARCAAGTYAYATLLETRAYAY